MTAFIFTRPLQNLVAALTAALCATAPAFAQNVIRGTSPGWPGNTAYYAPQTVYQTIPAGGAPVVQAQYAPQPAVTAYYAPASAARIAYAVPAAGSYQISYAGANQPGVSTTAYYGGYSAPVQRVAYLPQQVYYAPQAVGAPVTYYRTVVAYQPGTVAPTTCNYAAACTTSSCVSSCASSCGSGGCSWRPFAWLWGSGNSCCKPQTCNYGGCGSPCGAPAAVPYYVAPTAPAIPTVPAPTRPFGNPVIPSGTPTIPPPGTRSGIPGSTTIIPGANPADMRPTLGNPPPVGVPPSIPFTPNPGTGFSNPAPSGGFPPVPGGGFPTNPGGVRDDRFRPTLGDPYSQPLAPVPANDPIMLSPPTSTGSQILGSGFSGDRANLIPAIQPMTPPAARPNTITEPGFIGPPSSVQPLRDPHGEERNQPSINNNNRAPQLITPGDRTASTDQRWSVIPAVWPQSNPAKNAELQPVAKMQTSEPLVPVAQPSQLDDSGWKSAR